MRVLLLKSPRKNKKWRVVLEDGETVDFGDDRYEDYTQHQDKDRREAYIKRHKANEDWSDKTTAGYWSRWLLWEKPSLKEAKRYIRKKFNIKIKQVRRVDDDD